MNIYQNIFLFNITSKTIVTHINIIYNIIFFLRKVFKMMTDKNNFQRIYEMFCQKETNTFLLLYFIHILFKDKYNTKIEDDFNSTP